MKPTLIFGFHGEPYHEYQSQKVFLVSTNTHPIQSITLGFFEGYTTYLICSISFELYVINLLWK